MYLDVPLSQQCVIAIRHRIVELHAQLQTLSAIPFIEHYAVAHHHNSLALLHPTFSQFTRSSAPHACMLKTELFDTADSEQSA